MDEVMESLFDCVSPYVAVGTLVRVAPEYLELKDADMHDLRDTDTTREIYLVKTARLGVQHTREVLVFRMDQLVGISRLEDVVAG
jgi:hypothetical protein